MGYTWWALAGDLVGSINWWDLAVYTWDIHGGFDAANGRWDSVLEDARDN